jgi:hypothetical protein
MTVFIVISVVSRFYIHLTFYSNFVFISVLFFAEFVANYGHVEDEAKPTEGMI